MLRIKSANIWPSAIADVVNKFQELTSEHQIVVDRQCNLDMMILNVEYKPETKNLNELAEKIAVEVKDVVNVTPEVVLLEKGKIAKEGFKVKRCIDLRKT